MRRLERPVDRGGQVDGLSQYVLDVARQIITPEVRAGGSFAGPVPPGPDAGLLDRLVAFTGRAPSPVR